MKKSVKAALLSGLVFPGAGHFSLKRYQRGFIFFAPALLAVFLLVQQALDKAYAIVEQIERGRVALDAEAISRLISEPPGGQQLLVSNIATWMLVACWLLSMVDSFRLGKQADQSQSG